MKVVLVAVGGPRGPLAAAVAEYEERARRYWPLDVVEVREGASGAGDDPDRVRAAEGERLLERIPEALDLWALTRTGKGITSRGLARYLEALAAGGSPGVAFVLGGAFGLDERVLARARRRLTLSPMTLPHDLARLVLAEQLYRAGTIRRSEPYHKGG